MKKHVFSSPFKNTGSQDPSESLLHFEEGTVSCENPELLIEDVRGFKLEMMTTSVLDETDRRGGSSSSSRGSSNDNSKHVIDDKVFEETVKWIRNALGVK